MCFDQVALDRMMVSKIYNEYEDSRLNDTFPCKNSKEDNEPCLTCPYLSICYL